MGDLQLPATLLSTQLLTLAIFVCQWRNSLKRICGLKKENPRRARGERQEGEEGRPGVGGRRRWCKGRWGVRWRRAPARRWAKFSKNRRHNEPRRCAGPRRETRDVAAAERHELPVHGRQAARSRQPSTQCFRPSPLPCAAAPPRAPPGRRASMPCRRIRMPLTSTVSPSMTNARPDLRHARRTTDGQTAAAGASSSRTTEAGAARRDDRLECRVGNAT